MKEKDFIDYNIETIETIENEKHLENSKINGRMDVELQNLYDELCRNLSENSQLDELFLRFFQTKTKLAFLFDEKDYKLLLMKFLAFFNELITKINVSSKEVLPLSQISMNSYNNTNLDNGYVDYMYDIPKNLEFIPNKLVSPLPYPEIPYLNNNFMPQNFANISNELPKKLYSPNKTVETVNSNKLNNSAMKSGKSCFYGDLGNIDFKYTKYDPKKHDHCKNKNFD